MNLEGYYKKVISKLGYKSKRPYLDEIVIPTLSENWEEKNVFLVEAPTGYGKTSISLTASLYSLNEEMKTIVAFPQRSLLENQYIKFERFFEEELLGKRYMHNPDSLYLLKPVTLTTVDTLSLTMLGIPPEDLSKVSRRHYAGGMTGSLGHYLFSAASIALSNIVFDEAHLMADSTKSLNFLAILARFSIECGRKLILMSATMPESMKKALMDYLRTWKKKLLLIEFSKDNPKTEGGYDCVKGWDEEFVRERVEKNVKMSIKPLSLENKYIFLERWLSEKFKKDSQTRVIVVFNTVQDACNFYKFIEQSEWIKEVPKLLIHSRFIEADRKAKSREIEKLRGKDSYLIVATQVVEVGVDISSNAMVTELAPASSLIQRLGRFLRYEEKEGETLIWYESFEGGLAKNNGRYKVYARDLASATLSRLEKFKEKLSFHSPLDYGEKTGYLHFLNEIYVEFPIFIDQSSTNEMFRITVDLEGMSEKALEQFLKFNGSFVREGFMVSLIPKKWATSLLNYQKKTIPVSYSIFKKLTKEGKIVQAIRRENEELKCEDFGPRLFMEPLRHLRETVRNSIVAFVADIGYNGESGLQVGEDDI